MPFFVGRDAGIFKKHGLNVVENRFSDSNQVSDALVKGSIDATDVIGSAVVLKDAASHPGETKVFLAAAAGPASDIHQVIVPANSRILRVADLAGKRLAVFPGTQMRVYAQLFLSKFMKPKQLASVTLVPLTPPQQVQAFKEGQVDGVLTLEPTGTELVVLDGGRKIAGNVLYENVSRPVPFVTSFGVLRSEWAQKSPATATALIEAYREIAEFIRTKPDEARRIAAQALSLTPQVAEKASIYDYVVTPDIDASAVNYMIDLMVREKVLERDIPANSLLYAAQR